MERIGTGKVDIAVDLHPYTEKGKTSYLPKDDIDVILWENEFELDRRTKRFLNRKRIRDGKAPLYKLPEKSSHELALEKLDQKKQEEKRKFDEYVRKQESNYIEYMVNQYMQKQGDVTLDEVSYIYKRIKANSPIDIEKAPIDEKYECEYQTWSNTNDLVYDFQQRLSNAHLSLKDLSNICKKIKENSPVKDLKEITTTATDEFERNLDKEKVNQRKEKKTRQKKEKKKKHYLKGAALAASLILGLIIPGKRANESNVAIVKNTTIESQINNDVKEIVKPQETENNTGNKLVVNNKVDTLKNKIKLTDRVKLKNATFHYSSTGAGPKVSQNSLPCDSYNIEKFAILSSNNELIDTIDIDKNNKNMSIDDLKTKVKSVYGEDVKIKMNVTGIENGEETYPKIGWTSINKVSSTAKTYGKKR